MPQTNYLIPQELTMTIPNEHLMLTNKVEPKMVFLAPNEEKFFLNFPSNWEKTLDDALGKIYNNGSSRYNFSIITYDGNSILSYNLSMLGMEFKTYLAGLLKMAKTIALYVYNGLQVTNYIICKP